MLHHNHRYYSSSAALAAGAAAAGRCSHKTHASARQRGKQAERRSRPYTGCVYISRQRRLTKAVASIHFLGVGEWGYPS